jgi:hypothetical protein
MDKCGILQLLLAYAPMAKYGIILRVRANVSWVFNGVATSAIQYAKTAKYLIFQLINVSAHLVKFGTGTLVLEILTVQAIKHGIRKLVNVNAPSGKHGMDIYAIHHQTSAKTVKFGML